jgi:hypothetical protein
MTDMTRTLCAVAAPDPFDLDIATALDAFRRDPAYAVAMARAAVTIQRKRQAWAERRNTTG